MVGEFESEHVCGLADIVALHEQAFADVDDVGVDVMDGRGASGTADQIAEIVGRIGQL